MSISQHILVSGGMRQTGYIHHCWLPFLIQLLSDIHKDAFLCLFPCSTWKLSAQRSMGTTGGSVWLCAEPGSSQFQSFSVNSTWGLKFNLANIFFFFFPAVCTNMCWGIYCTFGDNDSEATLTYDDPDRGAIRAHRVKAGCNPSGNCCAGGPPDANSCDEYPFATTEEADQVQQINRCVPQTENSHKRATVIS